MDLKELGLRFAMGYLFARSSGASQKDAAVDSLFSSTIAQAREDVTGFTPEIAEVTTMMVNDLVTARRARQQAASLVGVPVDSTNEEVVADQVADPTVGVTQQEVAVETQQLIDGINEAAAVISRLEQLQAGILRRN